jgi:hypothetical protein
MMELDPESRRILDLARSARTPSVHDKARVERRFALALGLSAGAASAAASAQTASHLTASKSAASAVVLKWWAGSGALLAAAVASYAVLTPSGSSPEPPATSAKTAAAQVATATTPAAMEPQLAAPAAPEPGVAAREQAAPAGRRAAPRRAADGRPSLAAELELLHRAQAAWRAREAARALAIVDEHRTRYPRSELRLEREALQVLALCELGRKHDAARVARALLARDPNTPLRASIEQSCALK